MHLLAPHRSWHLASFQTVFCGLAVVQGDPDDGAGDGGGLDGGGLGGGDGGGEAEGGEGGGGVAGGDGSPHGHPVHNLVH